MRTEATEGRRTGTMNSLYLRRQGNMHLFIIALFLTEYCTSIIPRCFGNLDRIINISDPDCRKSHIVCNRYKS
jgi:hypothetical protein